jgi:hypothetical protein
MKKRIPLTKDDTALVLFNNRHSCCICRKRKSVIIHHIDEDPSNNSENNLAVVCSNCHTEIHAKSNMSRKYSKEEITMYKNEWEKICKGEKIIEENNIKKAIKKRLKEPNDKLDFLKILSSELFSSTRELSYILEILPYCGQENNNEEMKKYRNNFNNIYYEFYFYYHRFKVFTNDSLDVLFNKFFNVSIKALGIALRSWNSMRNYEIKKDENYMRICEKLNLEIDEIIYDIIPKNANDIIIELRKCI